jgi:hypothetical protein
MHGTLLLKWFQNVCLFRIRATELIQIMLFDAMRLEREE